MIMASTVPLDFRLNFLHAQRLTPNHKLTVARTTTSSSNSHHHHHNNHHFYHLQQHLSSRRLLISRVSSDGSGGTVDASVQHSANSDVEAINSSSRNSEDAYVALFIRMLGLDNNPLDREQAILALWKYSQGGKHCIDGIMQFHGCINLTVNLLKSDSSSTCEAAAGLLRTISSVNLYRDSVAESGAVEEITSLLSRSSLTTEVKEQIICTLWNLSVDEKLREKMANTDLLPTLIKSLDDEELKVKEAAGGVLANLALSRSNHKIMVEAGVIPKLAKLLTSETEGSKVIRKEAKNALLELAKDEFYRILVMEEGLVLVPLVGVVAYKSLRPVSHSWPSLPEGTELERNSSIHSRYGASELLLGLNLPDKSFDLEEAKIKAIIGRTQQQFLARIGAIEIEDEKKALVESSLSQRCTLLPWTDGVARLVLILELEDASAISRAANSIADASINEHMRMSFMVAGAIKHLVRLLSHSNEDVILAACHALEKLSVSKDVCHIVELEGAVNPLIETLKCSEISEILMEKTMNILARIMDPGKEMKSKFYDGPVNGSAELVNGTRSSNVSKVFAGNAGDMKISKAATREDVLQSGVIFRLAEILRTYPNLQRTAASILEWIAITEQSMDTITAAEIQSGLDAVFHQKFLNDVEDYMDSQQSELNALEAEEAGLAISAASRLLMKLLDFEQFRCSINSSRFTQVLRKILKSDIPLNNKDWVAACLVKLESSSGSCLDPENPINMEVTIYETIPRLIGQIRTSFSQETQEAAVMELNTIISRGVVDFTRAVADQGGIFPLVKVIEEGSKKSVEASLMILFNLSMDSENHSAIIAAGAVPALRRIVLSQGPQWMVALRLLRSLPT